MNALYQVPRNPSILSLSFQVQVEYQSQHHIRGLSPDFEEGKKKWIYGSDNIPEVRSPPL